MASRYVLIPRHGLQICEACHVHILQVVTVVATGTAFMEYERAFREKAARVGGGVNCVCRMECPTKFGVTHVQ